MYTQSYNKLIHFLVNLFNFLQKYIRIITCSLIILAVINLYYQHQYVYIIYNVSICLVWLTLDLFDKFFHKDLHYQTQTNPWYRFLDIMFIFSLIGMYLWQELPTVYILLLILILILRMLLIKKSDFKWEVYSILFVFITSTLYKFYTNRDIGFLLDSIVTFLLVGTFIIIIHYILYNIKTSQKLYTQNNINYLSSRRHLLINHVNFQDHNSKNNTQNLNSASSNIQNVNINPKNQTNNPHPTYFNKLHDTLAFSIKHLLKNLQSPYISDNQLLQNIKPVLQILEKEHKTAKDFQKFLSLLPLILKILQTQQNPKYNSQVPNIKIENDIKNLQIQYPTNNSLLFDTIMALISELIINTFKYSTQGTINISTNNQKNQLIIKVRSIVKSELEDIAKNDSLFSTINIIIDNYNHNFFKQKIKIHKSYKNRLYLLDVYINLE